MSSEVLAIERLGPADVAGGLALSDAAGWNQSAADWSFFIAAGTAFGVRDERATLIATAAALPYDAATGWISMVLVDAAHRHRGIASQLVDTGIESLRAGGRTSVLDATPAGAAVYAKIGFVTGFAFERWQGTGDAFSRLAGKRQGGANSEPSPRPACADERSAATLAGLDRAATGIDRGALWREFLARPATRAWLGADGDGAVLRRAGRRATQVGPMVARDDEAALALLAAALEGVVGRIFIDVPVRCEALAAELCRRGFVRQRSFVRMALGDAHAAGARERVFALAGPEFG